MTNELHNKYNITKANGEPTDKDAEYFVLRIDTDPAARAALLAYADGIDGTDHEFAQQLRQWARRHEVAASLREMGFDTLVRRHTDDRAATPTTGEAVE